MAVNSSRGRRSIFMHRQYLVVLGVWFLAAAVAGGANPVQRFRLHSDGAEREPEVVPRIVDVEIRQFGFSGDTVRVSAGTEIRWTNRDPVPHTSTAENGEWESPLIEPGKWYTFRFDNAGTFAYYCTPHPFMRGVVVVEASE